MVNLILQSLLPLFSYDGVPFLMHDRTLQRTTNVHEVFPNRTSTPASMFTWAELESLNAGTWFLSVSPPPSDCEIISRSGSCHIKSSFYKILFQKGYLNIYCWDFLLLNF